MERSIYHSGVLWTRCPEGGKVRMDGWKVRGLGQNDFQMKVRREGQEGADVT